MVSSAELSKDHYKNKLLCEASYVILLGCQPVMVTKLGKLLSFSLLLQSLLKNCKW